MLLFNPYGGNSLCFILFKNILSDVDVGSLSDMSSWEYVSRNQAIVLVEPFELSSVSHDSSYVVRAAVSVFAAPVISNISRIPDPWVDFRAERRRAEIELKTTGKILGYKALLAGSNKLVWISHYDIEELKKQQ